MPSYSDLPDWERVLSAASRLQRILPDAVLVGGTVAAIYASHRLSRDADHVVGDLRDRFDSILAELESIAGWTTARVRRPVMILGSLDGIETGVRQLIRKAPLETQQIEVEGGLLTVPTEAEILRIKAFLILKRNATRDYLDFVALAEHLGQDRVVQSLRSFDDLYPQPNGESVTQQLIVQLANPLPYDLADTNLDNYKELEARWHDWNAVKQTSVATGTLIFEQILRASEQQISGRHKT